MEYLPTQQREGGGCKQVLKEGFVSLSHGGLMNNKSHFGSGSDLSWEWSMEYYSMNDDVFPAMRDMKIIREISHHHRGSQVAFHVLPFFPPGGVMDALCLSLSVLLGQVPPTPPYQTWTRSPNLDSMDLLLSGEDHGVELFH